jgi:hypothetical protein
MAPPDRELLLQAQEFKRIAMRADKTDCRKHPSRRSRDKLPMNLNKP